MYEHKCVKCGIQLPYSTEIGDGLCFKHYGGIVIAPQSRIGKNAIILHGVTIGKSHMGNRKGWPTIGDNCIIFAGAKIIGNIVVGDNCVIGTNAVVLNDVPNNAIVAGVPAKIIGYNKGEYQSLLI